MGIVAEDLYKIGAVAKRTGISPECLRAWERRYGLEPADRAGKTRFYSAAQVDRLETVKALLDQGHPISQVIGLDDAELRRRLNPLRSRAPVSRPQVGLVGGQLLLAHREAPTVAIDIIAEWASTAELMADRNALPALDCVVVYVPTLDTQQLEKIEQIVPEARLVVAFKYATSADLDLCRHAGRPLVRWPADWPALERRIGAATVTESPARCYSDEQLVHISLMASRAACDCPRHLAGLVGDLNDYAAHARRCAGDDDHQGIDRAIEAARAELEHVLGVLVERHGLLTTAN